MSSTAMHYGWLETAYEPLLKALKELESQVITAGLVVQINNLIGRFLEQQYEFVRANRLPKSKFTDFVIGVISKIGDQIVATQSSKADTAQHLFWRICYLYICGVRSFASRRYDWDDEKILKEKMMELRKAGKPVKAVSIHDSQSLDEVKKILNKLIKEKKV